MAQRSLTEHLDHLPLFPLPEALLFPKTRMSLHIFEPRYRQMVQDARRDELPIAIGHIRGKGPGPADAVAVHPVLGAGFIDTLEELPDGRFIIELLGEQRLRIVEEKPSARLYRVVRARPVLDLDVRPEENQRAVEALRRVVLAIHQVQPQAAAALSAAIAELQSAGEVADSLAGVIHTDPQLRQGWLEDANPVTRLRAVTEALESYLVQGTTGQRVVH